MSTAAGVRQLHLIQRNAKWLGAPISTSGKVSYYGHIITSLMRSAAVKENKVRYLGNIVHYDNFATPLTLQLYPHEINSSILSNIGNARLKKVLDIGGNIGQFSLTLSHALKDKVRIDVLEPNGEIFELLHKNTGHKRNIRIFNYGVGKPTTTHMFYTPGISANG